MGAAAVSGARPTRPAKGATLERVATFTLSSSYATGGDTFSPGAVGLHQVVEAFQVAHGSPASAGMQVVLGGTPTAPKLRVLRRADAGTVAEMPAATNLSAVTVKMVLRGT